MARKEISDIINAFEKAIAKAGRLRFGCNGIIQVLFEPIDPRDR